jgi:hypothetical protein
LKRKEVFLSEKKGWGRHAEQKEAKGSLCVLYSS